LQGSFLNKKASLEKTKIFTENFLKLPVYLPARLGALFS